MEIPIRPKLYSFHEAFNTVGRKLVPGWTGDEINAQKCHSPEKVESIDTLPKRLAEFTIDMGKAPDVDPADLDAEGLQDLQNHIDGVEHARLNRQSAPWAREIKDLGKDREAYQARYELWVRYDKAYKRLIDILHDGYAPSWLVTKGGDTYKIQRTHWGGVGGPFTPNLPGDCGEYRGAWGEAWGEVWIDKKGLDRILKIAPPLPAAEPTRRGDKNEAIRQRNEKWITEVTDCEQEHPDWTKKKVIKIVAKRLGGINREALRRLMYTDAGSWGTVKSPSFLLPKNSAQP